MEHTSNKVDGPWKTATLIKNVPVTKRTQNIPYEIIVNKQNEVIGVIVTHHISRESTVSPYFIKDMVYMSTQFMGRGKQSIKLVCHLDTKFSLLPQTQESGPTNSRKRKTQA
ncbi:Bgt-51521 [Blumeria graminis f. sp. tritici]|uniref:Bgt-51521 n=2 Tax=Blumeria graminis TaxID=34373 RepID=A0A9X9MM32_BLUGR|nr:Bgt-51521 [Blumeria graminis f. sp. tritici]